MKYIPAEHIAKQLDQWVVEYGCSKNMLLNVALTDYILGCKTLGNTPSYPRLKAGRRGRRQKVPQPQE